MQKSFIHQLRQAVPKKRSEMIQTRYDRNLSFFENKYPQIANIIRKHGDGNYAIKINSSFLEIRDKKTGELCHPEAGLDKFSEALGGWTHNAWTDFVDLPFRLYQDNSESAQCLKSFSNHLVRHFPRVNNRVDEGQINMPHLGDQVRFSNSTIFLGIFHGLHIDHYLSRCVINNAAFVEPDSDKFVLSCGFIDYEALDEKFGGLILYVGEGIPQRHIDVFFDRAKVTGAVWTRILCGYSSANFKRIIEELRIQWLKFSGNYYPSSSMIKETVHGLKNLSKGERFLTLPGRLSQKSTILIVGGGPSLNQVADWIKKHQQKLVIFATSGCVKVLSRNGITPDFQFSVEANDWAERSVENNRMFKNVPIVVPYKNSLKDFKDFPQRFLFAERHNSNLVDIKNSLYHTHPTTGNLAVALACYLKPANILLVGMDFGFISANQTHASGSIYDDMPGVQDRQAGKEQVKVKSNFPGTVVYSTGQFNTARIIVERSIKKYAKGIKIYNLSDGALTEGAKPCRMNQFKFPKGYNKENDVQAISDSFSPCEHGIHWDFFEKSPIEILNDFVSEVKIIFDEENFDWKVFTVKIDSLFRKSVELSQMSGSDCYLLDAWYDWTELLLCQLYRFMILTNSHSEAQTVYQLGRDFILNWLETVAWPDEVEQFLKQQI